MTIIRIFLGTALLAALFAAGWNVYRRLPADGSSARTASPNPNSELTVILRSDSAATPLRTQIEIYPIDYAAVQRDFSAAVRPGKTFDDFLAQRTKGLVPVRAQLDDKGRAVANLSAGNWWIRAHATLTGGEEIEWRLSVNVFGRGQTVELTTENAYERTKKF
ncbi:MAG TPA: hypothetical protein VII34_00295 [Pyrinomonadaceae bacterium]